MIHDNVISSFLKFILELVSYFSHFIYLHFEALFSCIDIGYVCEIYSRFIYF